MCEDEIKVDSDSDDNFGSREVTQGRYTKIICIDEPGAGGACHDYRILSSIPESDPLRRHGMFANINFQDGSIKDAGVNGCQNEDLVAILLDRLYGFQSGEFKCHENAQAITKFEEGLMWLEKRTNDRIKRGVEGTLTK